jgi:hypothetical protein
MLRIAIPATGRSQLNFNSFEKNNIPSPPNGVDAEINNDVLLLFDDEEQAINYAESLYAISDDIDDEDSPQKLAINDIVNTIYTNDFIVSYRSN